MCIAGKSGWPLTYDEMCCFTNIISFRSRNLIFTSILGVLFAGVGRIRNSGIAKTPNCPVLLLVKDEIGNVLEPSLPVK